MRLQILVAERVFARKPVPRKKMKTGERDERTHRSQLSTPLRMLDLEHSILISESHSFFAIMPAKSHFRQLRLSGADRQSAHCEPLARGFQDYSS
jgi:hypothetical protein